MKKQLHMLLLQLFFIGTAALLHAQAPVVDFNRYYWNDVDANGQPQDDAHSGEDWFYDAIPITEDGKPYGYVGAGYSSFTSAIYNGCYNANNTPFGVSPVCNIGDMDYSLNNNTYPIASQGDWCGHYTDMCKLAGVGMKGEQTWYQVYPLINGKQGYRGRFYSVIQDDEYLLAAGVTEYVVGLKSNPDATHPTGTDLGCGGSGKGFVVKTDLEGHVVWQYTYNMTGTTDNNSTLYHIVKWGNNYLLTGHVGYGNDGLLHIFMVLIDADGKVINKQAFIAQGTTDSNTGNLGRCSVIGSNGRIYTAGVYFKEYYNSKLENSRAFVVAVDATTLLQHAGNAVYDVIPNCGSVTLNCESYGFNIVQKPNNDLLFTYITDAINLASENGTGEGPGKVSVLDLSLNEVTPTPPHQNPIMLGILHAFDLQVGISLTPLSGGFVVVSTKKTGSPLVDCTHPFAPSVVNSAYAFPCDHAYSKSNWYCDPFVAKFNDDNDLVWSTTIAESTPTTSYGNYDFGNPLPTNYGHIGDPRLQGDLKREECFYKVYETDDGGLVMCGNNSNNLDDDALIKLHSNCQLTEQCTEVISPTTTISSTTYWTGTNYQDGILTIDAGGTLILDGSTTILRMADTRQVGHASRIDVLPGGKLVVRNGAKIMGYDCCPNDEWEGIYAYGAYSPTISSPNWPQNATYSGIIQIDNGTIENARNGVVLGGINKYDSEWYPVLSSTGSGNGGGILKADQANFINCGRAVVANEFINRQPGTGAEMYNISYLHRCNFETNDDMKPFRSFTGFAHLHGVNGIRFSGCEFKNLKQNLTEAEEMGYGINAVDAHFYAKPYNTTRCLFKNLEYGIRAQSIIGGRNFSCDKADFTGNLFGVMCEGVNRAVVTRNNFELEGSPDVDNHAPYVTDANSNIGIAVLKATQYVVEENNFTRANMTNGFQSWGTWMDYTGDDKNSVYKNSFDEVMVANLATGDNRADDAQPDDGLMYECNIHENSQWYDVAVASFDDVEGVRRNHGTGTEPAGNQFSNPTAPYLNAGDFMNIPFNGVNYFHKAGVAIETPQFVTTDVLLIAVAQGNTCKSNLTGDDGNGHFGTKISVADWSLLTNAHASAKMQQEQYQHLLDSLSRSDNLSGLLAEIAGTLSDSAMHLRGKLLQLSPYVTDTALMEMSNRTDLFPDAIIFEILLANPDALRSSVLINHLQTKAQPLPEWMIGLLLQERLEVTPRTLLEAAIAQYAAEASYTCKAIIHDIQEGDSATGAVNDSLLLAWLAEDGSLSAAYQQVAVLLQRGDSADAANLMESIPSLYSFTDIDESDTRMVNHVQLTSIYAMLQADTFTTDDREALAEMKRYDTKASVMAQSILRNYFGERIEHYPHLEVPEGKRERHSNYGSAKRSNSASLIKVYPNPAKDYVVFEVGTMEMPAGAMLLVRDALGALISQTDMAGVVGAKVLTLPAMASGVFTYELRFGNSSIERGKFTVIK